MPIRPSEKAKYPPDWKAIRARILARAGNRCEKCGKPNGATVLVTKAGEWFDLPAGGDPIVEGEWRDEHGKVIKDPEENSDRARPVKVVLTIAHLDHVVEPCGDDRLASWCQRCHLLYDAEQHQANAAATRRAKKLARQPLLPGL